MELVDRELFLKYALPCGQVIVKRGKMSQAELDMGLGADPKCFKVGLFMVEQKARDMDKNAIDAEAIRAYFWKDHNPLVEEESKVHADIDPVMCKVLPARYLGNNRVLLPTGERKVNIGHTPNIKEGECATVHYNSTCEIISENDFKELWELNK